VATLVHHLDALRDGGEGAGRGGGGPRVVLVAATNRPDAVDSALRQPGRLDLEVEVGVPNALGRREILDLLLARVPSQVSSQERHAVASKLHGCVGADLKLVVNMAVSTALRRAQRATPPHTEEGSSAADAAAQGEWCVEFSDLLAARRRVKPSALRETVVEVPEVRWGDIGGQEEAKAALQEAVEWPLRFPEAFKTLGIRPPAGVLLYGPPGCSKTLMAKALATESGLNFLAVKGPELFRKYVGDSEKAIAAVFRKARVAAPAVIFFDEIDALAPRRSSAGEGSAGQRVVSQLLNEMDGVEPLKQVVVVAATNRPDMLDAAFLRPGRIDRLIYVEPPDLAARKQILSIHLGKMPLSADVDLPEIAARSQGMSGAELANLAREAGLAALAKDASEVDMDALRSALSSCTPRITPEMLAFYSKFRSSNTVSI
jgi:AAA family ATPase